MAASARIALILAAIVACAAGAAETRKWLDEEFSALKVVMTELGLIRQ